MATASERIVSNPVASLLERFCPFAPKAGANGAHEESALSPGRGSG
jgi:hypothetical protein